MTCCSHVVYIARILPERNKVNTVVLNLDAEAEE